MGRVRLHRRGASAEGKKKRDEIVKDVARSGTNGDGRKGRKEKEGRWIRVRAA